MVQNCIQNIDTIYYVEGIVSLIAINYLW